VFQTKRAVGSTNKENSVTMQAGLSFLAVREASKSPVTVAASSHWSSLDQHIQHDLKLNNPSSKWFERSWLSNAFKGRTDETNVEKSVVLSRPSNIKNSADNKKLCAQDLSSQTKAAVKSTEFCNSINEDESALSCQIVGFQSYKIAECQVHLGNPLQALESLIQVLHLHLDLEHPRDIYTTESRARESDDPKKDTTFHTREALQQLQLLQARTRYQIALVLIQESQDSHELIYLAKEHVPPPPLLSSQTSQGNFSSIESSDDLAFHAILELEQAHRLLKDMLPVSITARRHMISICRLHAQIQSKRPGGRMEALNKYEETQSLLRQAILNKDPEDQDVCLVVELARINVEVGNLHWSMGRHSCAMTFYQRAQGLYKNQTLKAPCDQDNIQFLKRRVRRSSVYTFCERKYWLDANSV